MNVSNSTPDSFDALPLIDTAITRVDAPSARFSLTERMIVEKGSMSDWNELKHLHYKGENLPMGPHFWKLTLDGETIGVLVTGSPKGLMKERHIAFPKLKPGANENKMTNTHRYVFINQNIRVISRFVIDTMYRGIGAGYRMMNLVTRMEGLTFMEIQSSMSKFNYFGQKAGFSFVRPMNSNRFDLGLKFFRKNFASNPQDFEAVVAEIDAKSPVERELCIQLCREFYLRHSALEKTGNNRSKGKARVAAMGAHELVKAIQQLILASPMYGVYRNPDAGTQVPAKLFLSDFDRQAPHEKLNLPPERWTQ